jgi:hypothetical protein
VEVTDTRRYNAWLSTSWGIHSTTQSNKSTSFVTEESLPANEREYIRTMTGEDMKLYETIQDALSVAGKPSIDGRDLNAAAQKKT